MLTARQTILFEYSAALQHLAETGLDTFCSQCCRQLCQELSIPVCCIAAMTYDNTNFLYLRCSISQDVVLAQQQAMSQHTSYSAYCIQALPCLASNGQAGESKWQATFPSARGSAKGY